MPLLLSGDKKNVIIDKEKEQNRKGRKYEKIEKMKEKKGNLKKVLNKS